MFPCTCTLWWSAASAPLLPASSFIVAKAAAAAAASSADILSGAETLVRSGRRKVAKP
jgi:hypothetical protein